MTAVNAPLRHAMPEISDQEIDRLSEFVRRQVGISLGRHKHYLVQSRLIKRIKQLGLDSFARYLDLALDPTSTECAILLDMLTTNKTAFFREPVHFRFIQDVLLPKLDQSLSKGETLRCWSAACSSGEEPYSLAMHFMDCGLMPRQLSPILATDISDTALKSAIMGQYDASLTQHLPDSLIRSYFEQAADGSICVKASLKKMVVYRKFNLIRGPYAFKHAFDLVLCRNAMIYFESDTRDWVIRHLASSLKEGGYLFIGHSESIDSKDHGNLKMVAPTIYKKVARS